MQTIIRWKFSHQIFISRSKERPVAGGGGVFIAVHSKYLATCESSLDSDCEIAWIKMHIQGVKPLKIGCYYRPTDNNASNVYELGNSLDKISKRGSSLPNIFVTGDFNVPDIDWQTTRNKPNPQYGLEVNNSMCDILTENDLTQCNDKPTRENNILDLVCSTNPDLITNLQIYPGMSDHCLVITELNMKAKLAKKKPRQIYLFKRGNLDGMREDMENLYRNSFQGSDDTMPVELMWDTFKENMVDSINKHPPPRKQHLKDSTYHTLL